MSPFKSFFKKVGSGLLLTLIYISGAFAGPSKQWQEMSSGKNSYQKLGSDFYVSVPVQKIPGARLVLFNARLAQQLGLELPSDPKELEQMILDLFAYKVQENGAPADKMWMATRYLDSGQKGPGEAMGDGRALWSGELNLDPSGQTLNQLDVVLKGVGQTPLAWLKHADESHKDGLQSMREALHSFVMSEANLQNQLNSTADLAVIELPTSKVDHNGRVEKSAITVRIGEQIRTAHLRYWYDDPEKFKQMFDYTIRRVLKLGPQEAVTSFHHEKYLHLFASNIADEAARYYDLHAVHASPTPGNRTASGGTIDLGTFRYLDALHGTYRYLFNKMALGGNEGQTSQMRNYISNVVEYAKYAKVTLDKSAALKIFDYQYKKTLTELWLNRIGVSEEAQKRISQQTRNHLFDLFVELHEAMSSDIIGNGKKKMRPARYEPRKIFAHIAESLSLPASDQFQFVQDLLQPDRHWASSGGNFFSNLAENYKTRNRAKRLLILMKQLATEAPELYLNNAEAVSRARKLAERRRPDLGNELGKIQELPALESIQEGRESFVEITAKALQAVETWVDPGLKSNPLMHLQAPKTNVLTLDSPVSSAPKKSERTHQSCQRMFQAI